MKFGVATSGSSDPKLLQRLASKADSLGYEVFLVTDHYMNSAGSGTLDAWTFLSYVAAKTQNIKLGTCVTPIPFRRPPILAKMIATLDNLSNGRALLGAGAGWYRPEFEGFSTWLETGKRVAMTRESITLMKNLWTEREPVNYEGKYVSSKGGWIEPKPAQKPHPPIWFGTTSTQSLKTCGRLCDGWLPIGPRWYSTDYPRPERYASLRKIIVEELKKREISEQRFVFSCLIDYSDPKNLTSDVESYVKAGMNFFTLGLSHQRDETALEKLEQVARDLVPSFS